MVILPITHTRPDRDTVGVEIPARVREALGLDDVPSWLIVSEHNVDEWPNGGLAPLPGQPGIFSYEHQHCPLVSLTKGDPPPGYKGKKTAANPPAAAGAQPAPAAAPGG